MKILEGIHKSFGSIPVLRGISLELPPSGITCLLGSSGCGKSTLLRIAAGLEQADKGVIFPDPQRCAMVFQDPRLLPWLTVKENLKLALPSPCSDTAHRLNAVLNMVQLPARVLGAMPRELSGGMAQRVGVARALLREPELLLMDEPFASLDAITREKLQNMLAGLARNIRCLFVTHDLREAFRIACRICVMEAGGISETFDAPEFSDPEQLAKVRRRIVAHLNIKE